VLRLIKVSCFLCTLTGAQILVAVSGKTSGVSEYNIITTSDSTSVLFDNLLCCEEYEFSVTVGDNSAHGVTIKHPEGFKTGPAKAGIHSIIYLAISFLYIANYFNRYCDRIIRQKAQ